MIKIAHSTNCDVGIMLADYYCQSSIESVKKQYAAYYTDLLDEIGPQLEAAVQEYLAKC